ncbi:protein lethal(2)essential for life-like [Ochlerotatus camptorhynchus]|uniref:protein lethal(2)essential for life-like n=1 Tax=Ochlerotatus camptorhynchus TaxID=644619 RepID=UPI0031D8B6CD
MSVVPISYRDWWDEHDTPFRSSRLLDQHFGTGLRAHDLVKQTPTFPLHSSYYRPWRNPALEREHSTSTLKIGKDAFQIILDVQQFAPEEITVRTAEKYIIVQGKHEEKRDEHGYVSRHFTRRYALPEGHDPNDVVSTLSSDGVLTVTAPKKEEFLPNPERNVPIQQTGELASEHPSETVMERIK